MRETQNGSLQLLTQGTADIILDCCDDFWDGKDLRPLGPQERKRAQDFYQRSALTAYCTAFSYRPLRHGISGALAGSNKRLLIIHPSRFLLCLFSLSYSWKHSLFRITT